MRTLPRGLVSPAPEVCSPAVNHTLTRETGTRSSAERPPASGRICQRSVEARTVRPGKALGDPVCSGRVEFTRHPGSPSGPRGDRCLLRLYLSTQHPAKRCLSGGADFNSSWGLSRCQKSFSSQISVVCLRGLFYLYVICCVLWLLIPNHWLF